MLLGVPVIFVSMLFLLAGCDRDPTAPLPQSTPPAAVPPALNASIETINTTLMDEDAGKSLETQPACKNTAACPEGERCIDEICGTIASLYQTDCENACALTGIVISTSDGESYTLKPGQGSYTAAGALEWKVYPVPSHCPQENIPVPITLIMKNYGRIVEEKVITLREGQTSKQITHPQIVDINFTVTLERVTESCP